MKSASKTLLNILALLLAVILSSIESVFSFCDNPEIHDGCYYYSFGKLLIVLNFILLIICFWKGKTGKFLSIFGMILLFIFMLIFTSLDQSFFN